MAIWEKLFSKITFKDYPDTSTPLNATNLNAMTDAIDGIDGRVVELNSNLEQTNSNLTTKLTLFAVPIPAGETKTFELQAGTYLVSTSNNSSLNYRYDAIVRTVNSAKPHITELTPQVTNSTIVITYDVKKLTITNGASGTLRLSILQMWVGDNVSEI